MLDSRPSDILYWVRSSTELPLLTLDRRRIDDADFRERR